MNLKEWQKKRGLADYDILTQEHLKRVHDKKGKSEIIQCACGCGEWRPRLDKYGKERHYIRGHSGRGRKPSAEALRKSRETRWRNSDLNEPEFTRRRLIKKHGPQIEMLFSKRNEKAFTREVE